MHATIGDAGTATADFDSLYKLTLPETNARPSSRAAVAEAVDRSDQVAVLLGLARVAEVQTVR